MITLNRNTNTNILTKNVKSKEVLINNKTENKAQLSNNGLIDSKTSIATRNLSINYINLKSSNKDVNTIHNIELNKISFKGEKQVRESLKAIELSNKAMEATQAYCTCLTDCNASIKAISNVTSYAISKIYNTNVQDFDKFDNSLNEKSSYDTDDSSMYFTNKKGLAVLGFCEMKEQEGKQINLDDFKNSDFTKYFEYGKELQDKFETKE
ncbi:MAG: hypothetical protein WCK67_07400 [bacterium]